MRIHKSYIFGFFVVLLLASSFGCATPFKPISAPGGFEEERLAADRYEVFFQGNGYTSMRRAQDFALLRAAVLCEREGFEFFVLTDQDSWESVRRTYTPEDEIEVRSVERKGSAPQVQSISGDASEENVSRKPRVRLFVQFFTEPPEGNQQVFRSVEVQAQISQQYGIDLD